MYHCDRMKWHTCNCDTYCTELHQKCAQINVEFVAELVSVDVLLLSITCAGLKYLVSCAFECLAD